MPHGTGDVGDIEWACDFQMFRDAAEMKGDDAVIDDITLRDMFACQCMELAWLKAAEANDRDITELLGDRKSIEEIAAALAYRYADAMMKRREYP